MNLDIEELLTRLAAGELIFDDATLIDVELLGIRLRQVSLRRARLTRVELRAADLTRADLQSACLIEVDLRGAQQFPATRVSLLLIRPF
jgi:uncharacterized protein YjbI with pentapeptide repeats